MHCHAHALSEIKHLARGLYTNKALNFVLCFISIMVTHLVLHSHIAMVNVYVKKNEKHNLTFAILATKYLDTKLAIELQIEF